MHVAVLGIGVLGRAVAERLQTSGHTLTVYNRTRSKAQPLASLGIRIADSPADAIRAADCSLLLLADAGAIRTLVFAPECRSAWRGRTLIQMGTIGPEDSRRCHDEMAALDGDYVEAPVLGSISEAKSGTLLVMVGGTRTQLDRWHPLFRSLSAAPRLVGPIGHAATLKLALNHLIAAETTAFSLSLALLQRSEVSVESFMAVLKQSAVFAPTFEKKLPRLLARDYEHPNFSTRHLLKDLELFVTAAQDQGLDAHAASGIRDVLNDAIAHGHGEVDYSALYEEVNPRHRTTP